MNLIFAIERHCRSNGIAMSTFGRQHFNDPRFYFDLRKGREPRPDKVAKIKAIVSG